MNHHVLYRFFDDTDRLLYVGITNDPEKRFASHRATKPWWRYVTTIKLQRFESRGQLARAELTAIATEKPKYNVANAGAEQTPTKAKGRVSLSPGSTASVFGTVQPENGEPFVERPTLLPVTQYGCPKCYWPAVRRTEAGVTCVSKNCDWSSTYEDYMRQNNPLWRGED